MEKKKIIVCLTAICLAGVCAVGLFNIKNSKNNIKTTEEPSNIQQEVTDTEEVSTVEEEPVISPEKTQNSQVKQISIQKDVNLEKKTNLYNDAASSTMPLSVVAALSDVPAYVRANVEKLSTANNIYMAKKSGDKLIVITDNPSNIRHRVEITEVSLINGHQVKTTLGYNDKMKDSDNDIWEYNKDTKLPIRHTKYNADGDMEFIETWNYDEAEPIKYEMKDVDGHVISMRKETIENGTDLRVEHLVYDKNGNTRINVSATYEGPDVKRFTYYNADKPSESGSVFGEYTSGLKTKETVYTSDLKVKNYYTTEYKDGNRQSITIWDNQNKEVQKLLPSKEEL